MSFSKVRVRLMSTKPRRIFTDGPETPMAHSGFLLISAGSCNLAQAAFLSARLPSPLRQDLMSSERAFLLRLEAIRRLNTQHIDIGGLLACEAAVEQRIVGVLIEPHIFTEQVRVSRINGPRIAR